MVTAKQLLLITLIVCNCFFLATPIFAKNCNIDPSKIDYKGPFSILFQPGKTADDCSYPPDGSNLDLQVINNGRLTSQLVPVSAITHGDPNKIIPNADGTLNLSLNDLSTFGIGGDILTKVDDAGIPNQNKLLKYQKTIEAYKNYDITHLYREAYANGVTNFEAFKDWACDRDLCICNGSDCHINPSVYSNTSQLTPLKDQLQQLLDLANEIIRCSDSAYADTHQCSTFYPLPDGNSLTIANIVKQRLNPNDLMGSWNEFDDKLKFQTYSLHITQSAPTFILLVPQTPTCNTITCLLQQFFNPDQPGYIKAIIPETRTFRNGLIAANNQLSPLKDQTQAIIKPSHYTAATTTVSDALDASNKTTPLLQTLITAAKTRDPNCNQNSPPSLHENLGASATPIKNTNLISIIKNFFNSTNSADAQRDKQYCVYVFSPPDLVDASTAISASNNSLLRKLMPLKISGFDTKIDAPQAFSSAANGQTTDNKTCLRYQISSDGTSVCVDWDENYIAYTGGTNNANQPAGELPMFYKNLTFGIARPLKDAIPPNQCLVPWLNSKAVVEGFQLSETLNAGQYDDTICPNPIQPKQNLTSGDCRQALFEKGACPGGTDCVDYICANSGGLNCSLLIMIAANETGGLFSCDPELRSVKHFGCDPWGRAGYDNTIEAKLQCAVNTLKGYSDLNTALQNYGYRSVNDLPWSMFGLTPATSLTSDNNNINNLKSEIYGGNTARWWHAYCNRFPNLVRETNQAADPSSYSCDRY